MTDCKIWLSNPTYILGDEKKSYIELSGFEQKIKDFNMPDIPDVWGWDSYFVSTEKRYVMSNNVVSRCLDDAIGASEIDHIIVSACEMSDTFMASNDRLKMLLSNNGLSNVPLSGVSLTGCNNVLSAMTLAKGLLLSGMAKNILVVTEELARSESQRFDKHCIFSDAACAFILSTEIESELEFIDAEVRFSGADVLNGFDIFRGNLQDIASEYGAFLSKNGASEEGISCILTPNYYAPVIGVLLNSVRVPQSKRFNDESVESSHFFSCDFIINLANYLVSTSRNEGDILMFAYADMQYGFCLLRPAV